MEPRSDDRRVARDGRRVAEKVPGDGVGSHDLLAGVHGESAIVEADDRGVDVPRRPDVLVAGGATGIHAPLFQKLPVLVVEVIDLTRWRHGLLDPTIRGVIFVSGDQRARLAGVLGIVGIDGN